MSEFKLEKGIPIPHRLNKWADILSIAQNGDSLVLSLSDFQSFRICAKRQGFKVIRRILPDKSIRVWLLRDI